MKFFKTLLLFVALTASNFSFAQINDNVLNTAETNSFQQAPDFIALQGLLGEQGYEADGQVETFHLTSQSDAGFYAKGVAVSLGNGAINLVHIQAKDGNKVLDKVYYETAEGDSYSYGEGGVLMKGINWGEIWDCIKKQSSSIGTNCSLCVNCMKKCDKGWKWKKFKCLLKCGFSSPCKKCVGSVWTLIKCVWKAF